MGSQETIKADAIAGADAARPSFANPLPSMEGAGPEVFGAGDQAPAIPPLPAAFRVSRTRFGIMAVCGILGTGLGGWLLSLADTGADLVVPGFLTAIAAFIALPSIYMLFKPRTLFTLTEEGVLLPRDILLPWREITGVGLVQLPGQTHIGLQLRDPETFYSKVSPGMAFLFRASTPMTNGAPVTLSASMTGTKPAVLATWIARLANQARAT
ncbi:hypothetical protein UCD39_17455 [Nitrospirillum sp. BR 11752]|uniref:hypothetical protein n=1 Tax=Nitrospirillum sp. BR 11752 TaxID=3104293 RepID=UPI002EAAA063|nr:hypothetical protein [Nitrospirillum sp. BR 11752]